MTIEKIYIIISLIYTKTLNYFLQQMDEILYVKK
jgi:hypothetical protein